MPLSFLIKLSLVATACSYVEGPQQPVYRVVFWQKDLWEGYHGTDNDNLEIEVNYIHHYLWIHVREE